MTAADEIVEADSHRNGISGVPFYVGIVNAPEGRMLIITFSGDEPGDDAYTAVLDLDEAARGNIYMFPHNGRGGGNAWRGNQFASRYRKAIMDRVHANTDALLAKLVKKS